MSEDKVAAEVAEQEFNRFCEAMDLDVDPAGMDDDDKALFVDSKRRLVKAIRGGSLTIDEKGQPVFTPSVGSPIVFGEPIGEQLMAGDAKKASHSHARLFAVLAEITKNPESRFRKMANRDLKVCKALGLLFLGG